MLLYLFQFFKKSLSCYFPPTPRAIKFLLCLSPWDFQSCYFGLFVFVCLFLNKKEHSKKSFSYKKWIRRTSKQQDSSFCSLVGGLLLLLPSQCWVPLFFGAPILFLRFSSREGFIQYMHSDL